MAIENGDTKSARESNDLDREVARPSNERLLVSFFGLTHCGTVEPQPNFSSFVF
jgi:hypothetical protein